MSVKFNSAEIAAVHGKNSVKTNIERELAVWKRSIHALRQSAETSCTHIILENAVQRKDSEITSWFVSVWSISAVIRVIQLQYDYIFCISYTA